MKTKTTITAMIKTWRMMKKMARNRNKFAMIKANTKKI